MRKWRRYSKNSSVIIPTSPIRRTRPIKGKRELARFGAFLCHHWKVRRHVLFIFRFAVENVFLRWSNTGSNLLLSCRPFRFYCAASSDGPGPTSSQEDVFCIWRGILRSRSLYRSVDSFGNWLCRFLNTEFLKAHLPQKAWLYTIHH